jgi:hypothetical protein
MDCNWQMMFELNRVHHEEFIAKGEEWRRGIRASTTENQEGAEGSLEKAQAHLCGRREGVELQPSNGEEAVGW